MPARRRMSKVVPRVISVIVSSGAPPSFRRSRRHQPVRNAAARLRRDDAGRAFDTICSIATKPKMPKYDTRGAVVHEDLISWPAPSTGHFTFGEYGRQRQYRHVSESPRYCKRFATRGPTRDSRGYSGRPGNVKISMTACGGTRRLEIGS